MSFFDSPIVLPKFPALAKRRWRVFRLNRRRGRVSLDRDCFYDLRKPPVIFPGGLCFVACALHCVNNEP